ncbi:MAG: GNAT family N-acetyltransferase [Gemmatimonadota bacterium]
MSASLEIRPVRSKKEREAFIRLPWLLYADDSNWIPPLLRDMRRALDPAVHPFHRHSDVQTFLALQAGRPVGRIAAIHNKNHQTYHDEPVGFFGFFESPDDPAIAGALFDRAAAWLRERGLRVMRGPTSFSTNETSGLLIEGFDGPPVVMMSYNPAFYVDLVQEYGFRPAKTLLAYFIDNQTPPEYLVRAASVVERRSKVTVRPMRMKEFEAELATVKRIYNAAWERNWGFVPMTDEEFDFLAEELKPIVDPNLALLAEAPDGEVAGFALALPDFNQVLVHLDGRLFPFGVLKALYYQRKIFRMRVVTLGLLETYRNKGIDALLYLSLIRNGAARGITFAELSWVLEDNEAMNKPLQRLGGRVYRRYRLYDAAL